MQKKRVVFSALLLLRRAYQDRNQRDSCRLPYLKFTISYPLWVMMKNEKHNLSLAYSLDISSSFEKVTQQNVWNLPTAFWSSYPLEIRSSSPLHFTLSFSYEFRSSRRVINLLFIVQLASLLHLHWFLLSLLKTVLCFSVSSFLT